MFTDDFRRTRSPCTVSIVTEGSGADRVTAAAIARRLGIGRAAVTNWRRRYADFPAPVTDGTSPRFAWSDVERWLVATGKDDQLARVGRTDTGTQLLDQPEPRDDIGQPLPEAGDTDVTDLSADDLVARAMVALLPLLDADGDPPVVLDPACGAGVRLLAAAERYGGQVALVGRDVDEGAVEAARRQLRLRPLVGSWDVDVAKHSTLGGASAVVCVADARTPPNGGGPGDAALAWVRRCVELLRPRGVAVVAVPVLAAARSTGNAARADLVRRGVLRAVVALPPLPGTPDRLLWVLRQTPVRGDDVRMIDLSGLADPADVPMRARAWQRLVEDADPATVCHVSRVSLLDGTTDLTPSRYVSARSETTAAGLGDLTTRLRALYGQVAAVFPSPAPSAARAPRELVTVAELERRGELSIMIRDASPHEGDVILRTGGRTPVVAEGTEGSAGIAQILATAVDRLDAHFVALFLRPEVEALPVASTHGGLSRDDLRRCRIPRVPLAEQRRYGDAFRRLLALRQLTTALAGATGSLLDQTVHGLTTGALLPAGPAPAPAPRFEGEIE